MKTSRLVASVCLTLGALLPVSCASDGGQGSTATTTGGAAGSVAVAGNGGTALQMTAGTTSQPSAGTSSTTGGNPSSGGMSPVAGSPSGGNQNGAGNASGGTPSGGNASGGNASGGNPGGGNGSGGKAGSGSGGDNTGGNPNQGDPCSAAGLTWKSANKTNFESYPAPGSDECVKYSGCLYEGQFAFCNDTMSEDWVSKHNIASVFPSDGLENHNICIKQGNKTMVVMVLDTCGDSDCGGCCTQNKGNADRLIDLEKYTNQRWGLDDGQIQWADLGPNPTSCN